MLGLLRQRHSIQLPPKPAISNLVMCS